MFNLNQIKEGAAKDNRYERRMAKLVQDGLTVDGIKHVVECSIKNIKKDISSFVIYGEPQSGKTEMMIALTAKLLDAGYKIIILLLNDSVQLLDQNLERFQRSGIDPSPKKFNEIISPEIKIGDNNWIIFCKKNSKDLQKLITKLDGYDNKIIIDDEADYATPNSKINKLEKSKINELTEKLISKNGIYIGVTATPARLDLNRTHNNQNECWVDYPPHPLYTGQDVFFPSSLSELNYNLNPLSDEGDDPKYLREALFSFLVNVGYLNTIVNDPEKNYSFLVHTSGKKADHSTDYFTIIKTFDALNDNSNKNHEKYFKRLWEISKERYPGQEEVITRYIFENKARTNIVVMNSDKEKNAAENRTATNPSSPFTIVIGGNIVSRGVTFKNLLSMFFTRDVKHKFQQDTYIQRARMFGTRGDYLSYFELTIPKSLFLNWHSCFIFHRLSLESRRVNNNTPVWLEGGKITAAASNSIDKATVVIDRGEMSFDLFDYSEDDIMGILNSSSATINKLKALSELLGQECVPKYLIDYIENFCPSGDSSIALHEPRSISGYRDVTTNQDTITRTKGFIGKREREEDKFKNAIHHIFVLFNDNHKARVFYKYQGNIRFIKTRMKAND